MSLVLRPVISAEDEDYNQPSEKRSTILRRLQTALAADVDRHHWAACILCDIDVLKNMAKIAETSVIGYHHSVMDMPGLSLHGWIDSRPSTSTVLSPNGLNASSVISLSNEGRAIYRDRYRCVLTGTRIFELAHIYPLCLLHDDPDNPREPYFWRMLGSFWPQEKIVSWKTAVDANRSLLYGETASNLLCLSPLASALWDVGAFALKPVSLSGNGCVLTLQFFWQNERKSDWSSQVSLLTAPQSTRNLDGAYDSWLLHGNERIQSGQIFTVVTDEPVLCPLPSFRLLEMQWFCRRILAMAEPPVAVGLCEDLDRESDYSF